MIRANPALVALLLLAGCQLGGAASLASGPNIVSGDQIETTTLDAPVQGLAAEQAAENPGQDTAAPGAADATPESPEAESPEAESPEAESPEAESPEAADPVAADVTPENPVSAEEPEVIDPALLTPQALACQRQGGQWSRIGEGEARACITRTRDGGKPCDADRDCQGACLARSGSCAPITPLFGCNEVLQDDGRRMTLCLN